MKCSTRSDIPPTIGEMKLFKIRCEMKYPDKLSDIPPDKFSDEVTKIRCEMKYPDKLSDIPSVLTWSSQDWLFHTATDIY